MPGRNANVGEPVNPGLVARLTGSVREYIAGVTPGSFFSPSQPMLPQAPEEEKGRAWDFPVGYNIQIRPRPYEPIGFATLRTLADACELVRLGIETRKDQITPLDWVIVAKDGEPDNPSAIKRITNFLQYPDRDHDWETWLRLGLEDMLVIDAFTLWRHETKGGQVYSLDILDGATMTRKIDERGRTPPAPSVAYQQIIKGIPAWDFTSDELFYLPRNPRPGRVYGMSYVEQIMITVNTAIRRALYQYAYYEEGNVPDAIIGAPANWNSEQLGKFQAYWDAVVTGDVRRRVKFVPDGTRYIATKTEPLFDTGDEWLARVVMFCLSLPPNPFVKETNRATAATQQEVALEQGLKPGKKWVKRVMDRVIQRWFNEPGLEWSWTDEVDVDPMVQAQIDDTNIKNRSKTINEVRADRGDDDVPWGNDPPEEGKPVPDPSPIALDGTKTPPTGDPDGVTAGAAEKVGGRSLPRPRQSNGRRFRI